MGKSQENEDGSTAENPDTGLGWGRYLKQQRLSRSLTVEDAAKETLLEPKMIEAIEAEDCEALPASSFVKGYLRNYARFLEIDAEPLVEAFTKVCGEDLPRFNTVIKTKEASSNDLAPRYLSIVVGAVVVISIVFWWWSKVLAPAAVDSIATETPVLDSPVAEAPVVAESKLVVETEALEVETPIVDESEPAEEAEAVEPTPVAAPVVEFTLDELVLRFEEDSWVEITDANDARVYVNLGRAGTSKQLSGVAPFNILLGNAPGVVVEFNGEVYDHSRHLRRGNKARFSLGE